MAGHGAVLANILASRLAGLPAPLAMARLLLALGDALEELPPERAIAVVAHHVCEPSCRGSDDETCMDDCMASTKAMLERAVGVAGRG